MLNVCGLYSYFTDRFVFSAGEGMSFSFLRKTKVAKLSMIRNSGLLKICKRQICSAFSLEPKKILKKTNKQQQKKSQTLTIL